MQRIIGGLLRVGVLAAAFLALLGGVWHLVRSAGDVPRYGTFRGEPASLTSIGGILHAVVSLRSDAMIQLGLLVLIAVPLLRVAVSVVAFAVERDWLYFVVTMLVLGILLFSLLGVVR